MCESALKRPRARARLCDVTEKAEWSVIHNMLVNVSIATIIAANFADCVTSDTERKEYCSWRYV
jgi:uncharacterized membrane protein